jgi:hypothetical protein
VDVIGINEIILLETLKEQNGGGMDWTELVGGSCEHGIEICRETLE